MFMQNGSCGFILKPEPKNEFKVKAIFYPAQVQVPNLLSKQARNPDPKIRQSLKTPKIQLFGLGLTQ